MPEQSASGHIYSRKDFTWRDSPGGWALHATGHQNAIVHIVPDATYPGMWRIRHPDGQLFDMANLTRARDGALAAAMRLLDPRKREAEQRACRTASRRANDSGVGDSTAEIPPR